MLFESEEILCVNQGVLSLIEIILLTVQLETWGNYQQRHAIGNLPLERRVFPNPVVDRSWAPSLISKHRKQ